MRQTSHVNRAWRCRTQFIAMIERYYDAVLTGGFAFRMARAPALISTARKRTGGEYRAGSDRDRFCVVAGSPQTRRVCNSCPSPTVPFTNNMAERDGRM